MEHLLRSGSLDFLDLSPSQMEWVLGVVFLHSLVVFDLADPTHLQKMILNLL